MCRSCLSLVITWLMCVSAQAQFAAERQGGQGHADSNAVMQMQRDLQEARDIVKRLPASTNRDRLELLLTRTELQLKQISSGAGAMARPNAVTPEEFNRLSISMRNQAFDKDKYVFLESIMPGRHFTSDQAAGLLRHFSFDTDRIRGAVLLYPQLTDQNNFQRVLEVFVFETSKKTVMERVRNR